MYVEGIFKRQKGDKNEILHKIITLAYKTQTHCSVLWAPDEEKNRREMRLAPLPWLRAPPQSKSLKE